MFREPNQPSKMDPAHFGAGSIIKGNDPWLVVSAVTEGRLGLLNLKTMTVNKDTIAVEDVNYITRSELAKLVELTKDNWTISDYTFVSVGLKQLKIQLEAFKDLGQHLKMSQGKLLTCKNEQDL